MTINRRKEANIQEKICTSLTCQKVGHMRGAPRREADDRRLKGAGWRQWAERKCRWRARAPQHIRSHGKRWLKSLLKKIYFTYKQTLQDPYLSGWGIQPRLSPCPKQHRNLPWKEPRVTPVECIPPQSSAQSRPQALVHHDQFQRKGIRYFTPLTCLENPSTHPDSSITRSRQGPQGHEKMVSTSSSEQ